MFSYQLMNSLEGLVGVVLLELLYLVGGDVSLVWFQKPMPAPLTHMFSFLLSLCLLTEDQDTKLSATALTPLLPTYCHDDNVLTLRSYK